MCAAAAAAAAAAVAWNTSQVTLDPESRKSSPLHIPNGGAVNGDVAYNKTCKLKKIFKYLFAFLNFGKDTYASVMFYF